MAQKKMARLDEALKGLEKAVNDFKAHMDRQFDENGDTRAPPHKLHKLLAEISERLGSIERRQKKSLESWQVQYTYPLPRQPYTRICGDAYGLRKRRTSQYGR